MRKLISLSDLNPSNAYDKILSSMMVHCTKNISEEDYKKTLLPENISDPSAIKFEFYVSNSGELTDKEKAILEEIGTNTKHQESDPLLEFESTQKYLLVKLKNNLNYIYIALASLITICIYCFSKRQKKNGKQSEKIIIKKKKD